MSPAHPHPVRLLRSLRIEEVDAHRRAGCRHYLDCLDRSARQGWLSFTCVRCFAFRPLSDDGGDWSLADALAFLSAGRGNRTFPSVEWYLATRPSPDPWE
jgi:hypothetical protein